MASVEDLTAGPAGEARGSDRTSARQGPSAVAEDSSRAMLDRLLEERARDVAAEPRVPLAFRVGGIGHRAIEADDIATLNASLRSIFDVVGRVTKIALAESR